MDTGHGDAGVGLVEGTILSDEDGNRYIVEDVGPTYEDREMGKRIQLVDITLRSV